MLPGVFSVKFPSQTTIIVSRFLLNDQEVYWLVISVVQIIKIHSTVKVFIACTLKCSVSFLSCAWGGRVSDIEIVRSSGFTDQKYHHPRDQILAGRDFTLQDDFASICGAELIILALMKGRKQLSAKKKIVQLRFILN